MIEGKPEDAKAPFKTVPARRAPTLQDLMRHTAGMTYGNRGEGELFKAWPQSGIATAEMMTGEEFLKTLGADPVRDPQARERARLPGPRVSVRC